MKIHSDNDILAQTCTTLAGIAENDDNKVTIAAAGGIPVRITALVQSQRFHALISSPRTLTVTISLALPSLPLNPTKQHPYALVLFKGTDSRYENAS